MSVCNWLVISELVHGVELAVALVVGAQKHSLNKLFESVALVNHDSVSSVIQKYRLVCALRANSSIGDFLLNMLLDFSSI